MSRWWVDADADRSVGERKTEGRGWYGVVIGLAWGVSLMALGWRLWLESGHWRGGLSALVPAFAGEFVLMALVLNTACPGVWPWVRRLGMCAAAGGCVAGAGVTVAWWWGA